MARELLNGSLERGLLRICKIDQRGFDGDELTPEGGVSFRQDSPRLLAVKSLDFFHCDDHCRHIGYGIAA